MNTMSGHGHDLQVCVRGSGAVGLSLALALAHQGLRVGVQAGAHTGTQAGSAAGAPAGAQAAAPAASAPPPAADVRAYALNSRSRALLQQIKVWEALPPDAVTPVEDMAVAGDAAGALIEFSAWQQGTQALAWIVDAAELEQALRTAARFSPHLQWLDDSAADATRAARAELQVLAEGKHSAGRAALGVAFERHDYGQTALAARLQSDLPHGQLARQWMAAPDILALLPFDRPLPGRSYALVWSLPPERAQALRAAPVAEFEAELMLATGGMAGSLTLASERACWPLAIARADRVCGPGWVLVGDAAHQVHPLAGQGLNLGLGDVVALAAVIAAREPWRSLGDERLLRRFERARALPNTAMALMTDGLQRLFAQPHPLAKELRNRGLSLLNQLAPVKRALTARALDA